MKTKLIFTIFTALLFLSFGYEAHAENLYDSYEDITESNLKNSIILSAESPIAFVDGQKVSGVQPIIRNGRTLVPLRFISEGLGAKVEYNSKNKSIAINLNGNNISLKLENNNISINGQSKAIDVAPSIYNNLTYIPLRDIGEALNKKVVYLKNTEIQSYSLIIIRDTNATAIENLNLVRVLDLVYKGKAIVYSDRFIAVIKENGQLFFSNNFYDFNLFEYKEDYYDENIIKLGDIWFKTDMGNIYLNYDYH